MRGRAGARHRGRVDDHAALDAGPLRAWVDAVRAALAGDADSDVACDGCVACCASSQFVHIGPDEVDALAHIPSALLFPAPGAPAGHVLMGYDERGRCPMLGERGCTVYAHRPRTCRTYDCRVFAATGVDVAEGDPAKAAIAARARRWRFAPDDPALRGALAAAAAYLRDRADALGADAPPTATSRAVAAVAVHDAFAGDAPPPVEAVRVALRRR